ncbi:MAG: PspA/IM30 family protein [Anaerolineae bacterium]|nr:PspA/IM30 family protein [Anaerolineae bacterium]
MAILDRIGTIIRANLNDMLDKSEDPEKMLDQILRDMKSAIEEARAQVAEMIAQQRMIEADVQRATAMVNEWDAKARAAVQQGRDDLARDSLRRKADYKKNLDLYQQQLDTQRSLVQKLKDDLAQLEFKYDDALRRHDELINRSRRAAAQQRLSQQAQKFNSMDPTSELSRMEAKIRGQEAQVEADQALQGMSLDAQFQELERSGDVEDELARLKSESSAPAPKKPSGGDAYPS